MQFLKTFLHNLKQQLCLGGLLFLLLLLGPQMAMAYDMETISLDGQRSDFVVGPGKLEVDLDPGQSRTIEILVSNRTGMDREFTIDVEDFTGSSDPETPVILLGNDRGPYSLRDYITVSKTKFFLPNGKRARVPVTIKIPIDAEPGGHYGSVLFSVVSSASATDGQIKAAAPVVSRIGSLFFVRVRGDVAESGFLKSFTTKGNQNIFTTPLIPLRVVFENSGSVHLNPYGTLIVRNSIGNEIEQIDIDPWFVLPDSVRLRETVIDREFMFGRYSATLTLHPGYATSPEQATLVFWVLPWKPFAFAVVAILLLSLLVRLVVKNFEIKRK
jgi:hypothetical protein